jgi:hypothetical protein
MANEGPQSLAKGVRPQVLQALPLCAYKSRIKLVACGLHDSERTAVVTLEVSITD